MPADVSTSTLKMVANLKESASATKFFDSNQLLTNASDEGFNRQLAYQADRIKQRREAYRPANQELAQRKDTGQAANYDKPRTDSGKQLPDSSAQKTPVGETDRKDTEHTAGATQSSTKTTASRDETPDTHISREGHRSGERTAEPSEGKASTGEDDADSNVAFAGDAGASSEQINSSNDGVATGASQDSNLTEYLESKDALLENGAKERLIQENTLEDQIHDAELIETQLQQDRNMLVQLTSSQAQAREQKLESLLRELESLAQANPELAAAVDALKEKFEMFTQGESDLAFAVNDENSSEINLDDLIGIISDKLQLSEALSDDLRTVVKSVFDDDLQGAIRPLSWQNNDSPGRLQEKIAALLAPGSTQNLASSSAPAAATPHFNHRIRNISEQSADLNKTLLAENSQDIESKGGEESDLANLLDKKLLKSSEKESELLLKNLGLDIKLSDQKFSETRLSELIKSGELSLAKLKEVTDSLRSSATESSSKTEAGQTRITSAPLIAGVNKPGEQAANPTGKVFQTTMQNHFSKPNWTPELGQRLMMMVGQKIQVAEIRLDPPDLGPMEVKVRMQQDQAHVVFNSQHAAVRDTLEQAIPRLRELFEQNGLSLGDVDVQDHSAQQQDGEGADAEGGGLVASADQDESIQDEAATVVQSDKLVDYYA
ncbi:MAG: flagellar hook-length control protein FliK [Pseudomonadales bacterium]|nr:flagellar hook-length control protein FliK [Pseudomonadales bacterium]